MSRTAESGRLVSSGSNGMQSGGRGGSTRYSGLEMSAIDEENTIEYIRQKTPLEGNYTKTLIFGGIDGLSLLCSLVFGGLGGNVAPDSVAVVSMGCLAAMAVNCGVGEFLSSKAHREFVQAEKRRGGWEFKNYRNVVVNEMEKRFEAKGMSKQDAKIVVSKMAQYEGLFINHMVSEDLGLQLPEDNDVHVIADTFLLIVSYGVVGLLPMIPFLLGSKAALAADDIYSFSIAIIFILLSILGGLRSTFSVVSWWLSAIEAIAVGIVIAGCSYCLGHIVSHFL